MDFPGGSDNKESDCNSGDLGSILGSGRASEKEMATHSSILAWKTTWTEEPGRVQSTESKRVGRTQLSKIMLREFLDLELILA